MWIWYPGDFEIWLGNRFNNRRTERGAMFPPFWKQDSHWVTVEFSKVVELSEDETLSIHAEGDFNFMLDGKLQYGQPSSFIIPSGKHSLNFKVHNQLTPPALFVDGATVRTDNSWLATYEDKIWIDENGIAHGSGIYVPAATWSEFSSLDCPPSQYKLKTTKCDYVGKEITSKGVVYDFGKETMGYVCIHGITGHGRISVYYGESKEEATDKDFCETLDHIEFNYDAKLYTIDSSKAFRYVYIETSESILYSDISMLYEFSEQNIERSGSFECNDELLNKIWQISAYTMDLTTREFFMDGIKRDRWTWSGDAIQSYLMNYYLRNDLEAVKRTIRQLRGKDPVTAHINTIMDYTFYWFKSILDYYEYSGDVEFIREMYPKMTTLMDYCLGRVVKENTTNYDVEGMMEGQSDDWIFVDWVDFPMHKRGIMCFEQILFCKSLETMAVCAELLGNTPLRNPPQGSISTEEYAIDADKYRLLFADIKSKIETVFWNNSCSAYLHSIEDGKMNDMITKFPNMFTLIFDYCDDYRKKLIMENVMANKHIEEITTPYMRFYELEALCLMGDHDNVLKTIKDYWGGMIKEGATSFWEKYVPGEKGTEHLQMYGRPYGKSLCHAWGASPIYLLGKYFLGVEPVKAGYKEWSCKPNLSELKWIKGTVPTPFGLIRINMDSKTLHIASDGGKGTIVLPNGKTYIIEGKEQLKISLR